MWGYSKEESLASDDLHKVTFWRWPFGEDDDDDIYNNGHFDGDDDDNIYNDNDNFDGDDYDNDFNVGGVSDSLINLGIFR